jgi:hypothetical protein
MTLRGEKKFSLRNSVCLVDLPANGLPSRCYRISKQFEMTFSLSYCISTY